jgi:hypothetical protein
MMMISALILATTFGPVTAGGKGEDDAQQLYQPWAADAARPPPPPPLAPAFLSRTLGSNMVLQRAPQQAVIWGAVKAGTAVTTTFGGQSFHTISDSSGVWRQKLPATEATATPHIITAKAASGETATMSNVIFGDVYLCGGRE